MMRDPVWRGAKVCYIVIGRAASTSIRRALDNTLGRTNQKKDVASLSDDWFIFSFVRDPFDRFMSFYNAYCYPGQTAASVKERGFYHGMPILDAAALVCDTPDKTAEKHTNSQSHHLTRGTEKLIPEFVGKIEAFEEDWARLQDLLGQRLETPGNLSAARMRRGR